MVDAIAEEGAIRQPGKRVVEGLVGELILERTALGDVVCGEHEAAHRQVVEHIAHHALDDTPVPVPMPEPELVHGGLVRLRHRGEHRGHVLDLGRVQQRRDLAADDVVRRRSRASRAPTA